MSFFEWLIAEKGYTEKSAHDAQSRLKRILDITGKHTINSDTIAELNENTTFLSLSMSVKSQLRRTAKLYLEFQES